MMGPIWAEVTYKFPVPKKLKKEILPLLSSGIVVPYMNTPDLHDNLNKPLFDALQDHFYLDDKQVVKAHLEKIYAVKPGISLTLNELEF